MPSQSDIDNFRTILQRHIKPELNKLYTERPKLGGSDGDWGWFCKEHALHCFFVAKLMGFDAAIRRGEFVGRKPIRSTEKLDGISSLGSDSDHVWCQVEGTVPVDLSANFEFFGGSFPWIDIVFGPGYYAEYDVLYHDQPKVFEAGLSEPVKRPILAYLEKQAVSIDDRDLLNDPYLLLFKPGANGLGSLYGHDIFNKITLHLLNLALGKTERLLGKGRNVPESLATIRGRYPDPNQMIETLLASTGSNQASR